MHNTVQQFLSKLLRSVTVNEKIYLLKVSVLKRSFQTDLRVRAYDIIKHVLFQRRVEKI